MPPDDVTAGKNPTGIFNSTIEEMVKEYHPRFNSNVMCWMFSGGYKNQPQVRSDLNSFEFWSRAFATRVQPSLVATNELLKCVKGKLLLESPGYLDYPDIEDLCIYIPTLVRGMVVDAWIRKIDKDGKMEKGPLAKGVETALHHGRLSERECLRTARALRERAIERLIEIQNFFATKLSKFDEEKGQHVETLASIWACSRVKELVETATNCAIKEDCLGAGLLKTPVDPGEKVKEFSLQDVRKSIANDIEDLIIDAVDYIQMTAQWGGITQTIRAQMINSPQVDLIVCP